MLVYVCVYMYVHIDIYAGGSRVLKKNAWLEATPASGARGITREILRQLSDHRGDIARLGYAGKCGCGVGLGPGRYNHRLDVNSPECASTYRGRCVLGFSKNKSRVGRRGNRNRRP